MTNRFARNQTVWCQACACYRNKALDNRNLCQVCRKPHGITSGGWQHFIAADPKTDARVVVFVAAHYCDLARRNQILGRLQAKYPGFGRWDVEWRQKAARTPQEAFEAGL